MPIIRLAQAMRRALSITPCIRRVKACSDLNTEYQLSEYERYLKDLHNLYVYTNDCHVTCTEDEIFTPAERAVRNSQRQSLLLERRRTLLMQPRRSIYQPQHHHNDTGADQSTAGASPPISPCPSFSPRPRFRPTLTPINIALANTLGNLTRTSPTNVYATDTHDSEYVLDGYGQRHLQASWSDVQIMSRAGNMAKERRRGRPQDYVE